MSSPISSCAPSSFFTSFSSAFSFSALLLPRYKPVSMMAGPMIQPRTVINQLPNIAPDIEHNQKIKKPKSIRASIIKTGFLSLSSLKASTTASTASAMAIIVEAVATSFPKPQNHPRTQKLLRAARVPLSLPHSFSSFTSSS